MPEFTTKERILDAAKEIIWTRGWNAVGLNEILKAVGVPKGSFYHYFESKEHFGVEMLHHYIATATSEKHKLLNPEISDGTPLNRLLDLLEKSIEKFQENDHKCPCLVLKLASEVTDLSEPMRQVLDQGMHTWMDLLSGVFEEAKTLGQISPEIDAPSEAGIFRDLWAGSIQRATITKSPLPMENAFQAISQRFALLQKSHSAAASIA